jgi:hypothetical protein
MKQNKLKELIDLLKNSVELAVDNCESYDLGKDLENIEYYVSQLENEINAK